MLLQLGVDVAFGQKIAEKIGKMIPNEISKLNSYSKYYQYIPYVGQALSAVSRVGSAADAGATYYGDTGEIDKGREGVMGGIQGKSQDPAKYGSGYVRTGQPTNSGGWANRIGQVGEFLPSKESTGSFSGGGSYQGIMNMFSRRADQSGDSGGLATNLFNRGGNNRQSGGLDLSTILRLAQMYGRM